MKRSSNKSKPSLLQDKNTARSGCMTPQVMKLVKENKSAANQVIMAGKSRVPQQLRRREPLSKLMRRDLGEEFADTRDTVVVNITELAISREAPEILDRFNACSCDRCVEVFSRKIAERVPSRFARVSKYADPPRGSRELRDRIEPMRKIVLSEMIRELICSKKRCFHDDEEL